MTPTEVLFKAKSPDFPHETLKTPVTCVFCKNQTTAAVKTKDILSSGFTNYDWLKAPSSPYMCAPCAYSFNGEFRKTSFIAGEKSGYIQVMNAELFKAILNPPVIDGEEWIFCVTKSFKKHNAFRTRVNKNIRSYWLRWEEMLLFITLDTFAPLYHYLEVLYSNGFSKTEIETGDYFPQRISAFGLEKFLEYEELVKPFRGTDNFKLAIFVLKKNEDMCFLEVKPTAVKQEEIAKPVAVKKDKKPLQVQKKEKISIIEEEQLSLF